MKRLVHKKIIIGVVTVVTVFVLVFLVLLGINQYSIELSVQDGENIQIEYGATEGVPDATAVYKGTIFNKKGTKVEVTTEGNVDFEKVGDYEITYTAKNKKIEAESTITVHVVDTIAPVIELVENPDSFTSPVAQYEEEGFTAVDNYDGDITSQVISVEQDGIVTYTVSDSSGNETVVQRIIVYKDAVAPVITLSGKKEMTIIAGSSYTEPGFSAADDCDGDITGEVTVEGQVNHNTVGTYTVTYKVSDSSGNIAEQKRVVKVVAPSSNGKVIYLTFDDGPSQYTEKLLNVLDKYGVKATFFVTGIHSEYYNMIGETYRRGHTIALHTYSHQYSIYSSTDTYYADLKKIRDIVVAQTGEEPTLVRFPGGTSNTASRKYCSGIMTTLSNDLINHGYRYCDWNVSSGDGGGVSTEAAVINNVINGVSGKSTAIVLQHDTRNFSVEAVDDIIEWGLANGYTFKAMDENTTLTQHKPQN